MYKKGILKFLASLMVFLFFFTNDYIANANPQSIVDGSSGDVALVVDADGNWHLAYANWGNDTVTIKYVNSATAPNAETIVEYQQCYTGPCPPNSIADFEGISMDRDSEGNLHVAYAIETIEDEKIMYGQQQSGTWSWLSPAMSGILSLLLSD